ncbi:hypothetical protein ElyMa_001276100 [Elysia marginata]|uniref:Uncharacterized protein n=1 Tax=Elysia marginata TaxID=1093978 RepID=A0AAV4IF00_9GAST|nr:hypothetical protein ElyMa_001276100 [Elysia marginata]
MHLDFFSKVDEKTFFYHKLLNCTFFIVIIKLCRNTSVPHTSPRRVPTNIAETSLFNTRQNAAYKPILPKHLCLTYVHWDAWDLSKNRTPWRTGRGVLSQCPNCILGETYHEKREFPRPVHQPRQVIKSLSGEADDFAVAAGESR